jgi:hypothetical protein
MTKITSIGMVNQGLTPGSGVVPGLELHALTGVSRPVQLHEHASVGADDPGIPVADDAVPRDAAAHPVSRHDEVGGLDRIATAVCELDV